MVRSVTEGKAGDIVLMLGNEAIARGAIEAGIHFAAAYPGTPSSEILECLARASKNSEFYAEWSTNEMVAVESAAAAAWAGLRAITSMKQNGLNVVLDFLMNLNSTGSGKGGLVVVVADDPYAHSSTNEQDCRPLGKYIEIPMLEPCTPQEAKDIVPHAFEISEKFNLPVLIRETTRLGHSRGNVQLGQIGKLPRRATFDHKQPFHNLPRPHLKHEKLHKKLSKIQRSFESSPWNIYEGADKPSLLIITSGVASTYAREAIQMLEPKDAGILKLGTVYPLPTRLIESKLKLTNNVLFVEEITPYLEEAVRNIAVDMENAPKFYGKLTGHIPAWGELDPDKVLSALSKIFDSSYSPVAKDYEDSWDESIRLAPRRMITFCAGCPHLASYWSILQAIRRNKNRGIVLGDIGCYTLGVFYHDLVNSVHCMGGGVGLASGFGRLKDFGLDEPVIAVMGDSTFYHACIPALINILYNKSNVSVCILDNNATAMTGFQPHPGTGFNAVGESTPRIEIEEVMRGLGYEDVQVIDPFNVKEATKVMYHNITTPGNHVTIFRGKCTLLKRKEIERSERIIPIYAVDQENCGGEACKICSQQFGCQACIWDNASNKAKIDPILCNGCGVCATICPYNAIYKTKG